MWKRVDGVNTDASCQNICVKIYSITNTEHVPIKNRVIKSGMPVANGSWAKSNRPGSILISCCIIVFLMYKNKMAKK